MAMGNFTIGIGSFIVAGIINPIAAEFSVSIELVGFLITYYALAYAIGSPLLIWWAGDADRRKLLIWGLGLAVIGNVFAAVAPNYGLMIIARVVQALGAAVFTPTASACASLLATPKERGKAISIVFAGFAAATALGLPIGTFVGLTFGWRITFAAVAIFGLLALTAVYQLVPSVQAPPTNLAVFAKILSDLPLLLMLLVTLTQLGSQVLLFTFITPYIEQKAGFGTNEITLLLLVNGVAGFIGNLWGGYLVDRIGSRLTTLLFLVSLGLAFITFPLIETAVWMGFVSIAIWGAVGIGFNAAQQARLVTIAPQYSSAILGLNASFLYLGITAGSVLAGVIVSQGGLFQLPWVALGGVAISTLLFMGTYRLENRLT